VLQSLPVSPEVLDPCLALLSLISHYQPYATPPYRRVPPRTHVLQTRDVVFAGQSDCCISFHSDDANVSLFGTSLISHPPIFPLKVEMVVSGSISTKQV
jgi:hypothetical protein